jgi:hypothetical protein
MISRLCIYVNLREIETQLESIGNHNLKKSAQTEKRGKTLSNVTQ